MGDESAGYADKHSVKSGDVEPGTLDGDTSHGATEVADTENGDTESGDTELGDAEREAPLSPGESLALIEREQHQIERRLAGNIVLFYGPWGAAYLLGFGSVFLTYPDAGPVRLPGPAAVVITTVLFVVAFVVSVVSGSRIGRGVHGPSRMVGAMYGWAWPLGFTTMSVINIKVTHLGLPDDAETLLWSGSSLLLVGVLYLAGGALWQDRFQYGLGVWMLVTAAASVLAGVPGNFAVLALAGGGGLLLTAGYMLRAPGARSRS